MKRHIAHWACLMLAGLVTVQQGQAQPGRSGQQEDARRTPEEVREASPAAGVPRNGLIDAAPQASTTPVTRREASDLAREAFDGRVLSVRLDGDHWRIRMDEDGTVFSVLVDARSGAVARDGE